MNVPEHEELHGLECRSSEPRMERFSEEQEQTGEHGERRAGGGRGWDSELESIKSNLNKHPLTIKHKHSRAHTNHSTQKAMCITHPRKR